MPLLICKQAVHFHIAAAHTQYPFFQEDFDFLKTAAVENLCLFNIIQLLLMSIFEHILYSPMFTMFGCTIAHAVL